MRKPDLLDSSIWIPWSWGRGDDVWQMFSAASTGDLQSLQLQLAADPQLVHCQFDYRTPLHFAVRHNQVEAARWLIAHGADATYCTTSDGHLSPLEIAQTRGLREMQAMLEERLQTRFGICPEGQQLAAFIRQRDQQNTEEMVSRWGTGIADYRGNQPLHWAAMTRNLPLTSWLLDAGADIGAKRPDGAQPADLTNGDYWYRGWRDVPQQAMQNHWPILGALLARGAEYDLGLACRLGDEERVRWLLDADPQAARELPDYLTWYSGYPLRNACRAGYLHLVDLLLDAGADPNLPELGLAPWGGSLYDALSFGHRSIVERLLDAGADPNQEVESSGNCLYIARDEDTRDLLRRRGALQGLFACFLDGAVDDLALHLERQPHWANDVEGFGMAAERRHEKVVKLMLEYQPDLWERLPARLGQTPEITKWMVESGMRVNSVNWLGIHAIHRRVHADELETWVELGVDLELIDQELSTTALGWACRRGDRDEVTRLLAAGADRSPVVADWATPRAWAERAGHVELLELLG